jgi:quercetin dioxygenase-like cupin family protein
VPPLPTLGPALRALREERGVSLANVSAATGLSASFLSLVEQGRSDITLSRLMSLVKFYDVGLTDLITGEPHADDIVVRRHERTQLELASEGIELELLAPDTFRSMMPLLSTFAPGGRTENHASHDGEEFVVVLQGRLELELEGVDPIRLGKGDSAYFTATRPHTYRNIATGVSRALAVTSPPSL